MDTPAKILVADDGRGARRNVAANLSRIDDAVEEATAGEETPARLRSGPCRTR